MYHADDAAILSGDGDFLRYYGRRASGELYFLRRIFSRVSIGDARNQGRLALFLRQPPEDRHRADWTYTSAAAGDKGGKIRLLDPPSATSATIELVTTSDDSGAPRGIVVNAAAYPFAFPCAPEHDFLQRPLRLAAYALLGERRVVESHLAWVPLPVGAIAEWRTSAWAARPDGAWALEPAAPPADAEEGGGVADSWEELAEALGAAAAWRRRRRRRPAGCGSARRSWRGCAARRRRGRTRRCGRWRPYSPLCSRRAASRRWSRTRIQGRRCCRRCSRFATSGCAASRCCFGVAGERLGAQAFELLMRFAGREGRGECARP
jgi:hypothetical protein